MRPITNQAVLLEEYKELRQELRGYLSRRQQGKTFAYIVTLGVVGLDATKIGFSPIAFWAAASLVAIVWYDEITRIKAIFRVATYIEYFIETQLPDLNWETRVAEHQVNRTWVGRLLSDAELPVLVLVHAVLGAVRAWDTQPGFGLFGIVLAGLVVGLLLWRSISVSITGRSDALKRWKNIDDPNQPEGEPMADQSELLAEVQRALTAIRIEAERLAGQVRALETVVERYGQDDGGE